MSDPLFWQSHLIHTFSGHWTNTYTQPRDECACTHTFTLKNKHLRLSTFHMLTFTVVAAELCEASSGHQFTSGLAQSLRVAVAAVVVLAVGGGRVLLLEHMWTSPFISAGPALPSLMRPNRAGMRMNTQRASDIMEFPLLRPSHLSIAALISHTAGSLAGVPHPTTPPDHRWTDYAEGRSSDSSKVKSVTVHVE